MDRVTGYEPVGRGFESLPAYQKELTFRSALSFYTFGVRHYRKKQIYVMEDGKMSRIGEFCKRKNIVFSAKRYGIDALGAMAQGLFCSLLIGTIIKTLGAQLNIPFLTDIGSYAMAVSGPAMAVAIGYALQAPPMVLFSLAAVGWAANAEGGAGGPLAVLIIAIVAAECGKAVSKETKIDILVTPAVTILIGVALA